MRNRIIKELNASMDAIHFSQESKENMKKKLMQKVTETKAENKHYGSRKLMLIALAAAMVLVTLTGAAAFTRWSKSAQASYQPSQEEKELAEAVGLSSMLESDMIRSTDQGVTITAVQSIVDHYSAQITFRIEGFALPDGEEPYIGIASIGVEDVHSVNTQGVFYNGTIRNAAGETISADGSPMETNPDGSIKFDYTAEDGSLEFTTTLLFAAGGEHIGKDIEVTFMSIGTTARPALVRGEWKLKWTLTGTEDTIVTSPNAPIGSTGVTLLEAEVSPISLHTTYKINTPIEIAEDPESYVVQNTLFEEVRSMLVGVRLKDGTLYTDLTAMETGFSSFISDEGVSMKYPEYESIIVGKDAVLVIDCQLTNQILDPEQVEAFVFLKSNPENKELWELTEENFYIIPIQ